ncbi:unnamed protein product [Pocillopora meandrina]|uniref:Uncharacterized protein n=1 Tax=Pocillopora meandrina TaxID=46732 RepID=A0AAU9WP79_9CNID|nr:unnamed protein product [Pocillopora meandrina]
MKRKRRIISILHEEEFTTQSSGHKIKVLDIQGDLKVTEHPEHLEKEKSKERFEYTQERQCMQGPALLHGETISRIIRKPETTSYIINI